MDSVQFGQGTDIARSRPGKRPVDLCVAVGGLLFLAPFFAAIAAVVATDSPGGVFFRQERIGRHGKPFRIWKFRTMVRDAERRGSAVTVGNDPRVTRTGRWLRRYKLDELPQLINVLCGEMSLVGPRPEVRRYVELYSAEQRQVLSLLPGITDPASLIYRDEGALLEGAADPERYYVDQVMPEKIRLNLDYARKATLGTDIALILSTVAAMWKPKAPA